MTTPQHGIQAALIQYVIYPKWYLIIAAALLGMRPDLTRLFQKDRSDWSGYNKLHELTFLNLFIPFSDLHIYEDSFMHDRKTGEWKPCVIYIEMMFWVLEYFLITIILGANVMLTAILTGLLFIAFAALAESYEFAERFIVTDILQDRYLNRAWHWFQLSERIFAILFGYYLYKMAELVTIRFWFITLTLPVNSLKVVFFITAVFWIVYDGAINIARNKNILFISGESTRVFDPFAYPWLKIGVLIFSIYILLFT